MITDDHFDTLRKVREEAASLRLACIAVNEAGSLLHIAYDPKISQRPSAGEPTLMRHLRAVP